MAKTYLSVFQDANFKAYADGITSPITAIAVKNQSFKLLPVQGTETSNTGTQYNIQRKLRVKGSKSVEKPNGSGSGQEASGTNFINRLNAFKTINWDTVETKKSGKEFIGVALKTNEELNLSEGSSHSNEIADMTKNSLIQYEEGLVADIVGDLATGTAITAITKTALIDVLDKAAEGIELLVDDYIAYSKDVVILLHPSLAKLYSDTEGQSFQNGTNTFPEGKGEGFRYNGRDYIVAPLLNTVTKGTDQLAAIVLSKQAIFAAGLETGLEEMSQVLFNVKYTGHQYSELYGKLDASRIKTFKIAKSVLNTAVSKKVNA